MSTKDIKNLKVKACYCCGNNRRVEYYLPKFADAEDWGFWGLETVCLCSKCARLAKPMLEGKA